MDPSATKHGKKRIRQRLGINSKATDRQAKLAKERGLAHKDTSGRLHKWIDKVSIQHKHVHAHYIVYNQKLFVFGFNDKVITILEVPQSLTHLIKFQQDKLKNKQSIEKKEG